MNLQNIILRNLKYLLLLISVIFGMSEVYSSSSVSSVNAYQEGKNIVITYQLSERSNICVYVSTDGGKKFSSLKSISGDFGKNVSSGAKRIIWNVLADYEKFNFPEVCFRVLSFNAESVKNNGHEYVDLGLPSGTLWASMNVGADSPEDYGGYFAWGETTTKSNYSWSSYKWCNGTYSTLTKYCTKVDNKITLELSDDAAYANWGGDWRMPTKAEQYELYTECTWTWSTRNGKKGYSVTGPNGNSIFLPAAGRFSDSGLEFAGSFFEYWSNFLRTEYSWNAYYLNFDFQGWGRGDRCYGRSVRAVLRVGITYGVDFDSNGGEGTMQSIISKTPELTIPENKFIRSGYVFIGWNTKADGTGESYNVGHHTQVLKNIILYAQWREDMGTGTVNGHEFVDLGLPSGTLWATCNVGATKPEDYGDYFAWGETMTKSSYKRKNYKWCKGRDCTLTKYNRVDHKTILELSDDAANANWGGDWRMPTEAEQDELRNTSYTTWTWTTLNGVNGHKVTSKINGNSIFLPAAGYRDDSGLGRAGAGGYYWSSSIDSHVSCWAYYLKDLYGYRNRGDREHGQSVRPVMSRKSGKSYRSK